MSVLRSNSSLLTYGHQSAKGTPQGTPNFSIPFIGDAPLNVNFDINDLHRGGDGNYLVESFKQNQKHPFSWECLATPELTAYVFAALLGADSVDAGPDPYTHTLTYAANAQKWLTLRKKLDSNIVLQLYDGKLATITMSWTAGEEVKLSCEGMALNSLIDTTEDSQDRDGDDPFMSYDAEGYINIVGEGRESFKVNSLSIKIILNISEQMSDQILLTDLIETGINIEIESEIYVEDTTNFYKKINFYNTSNVSEEIYTGQLQWGVRYYNGSGKERLFHITIPKLRFTAVDFAMPAEPGVIMQSIAGLAQKAAAAVTLVSGYSTDAYDAGDFDTPDDSKDMTEFAPMGDGTGISSLFCGTEEWQSAAAGEGKSWTGQTVAGVLGGIKFSIVTGNWTTFAHKTTNGMKTIKFPKTDDNDQLGGDMKMMYNYLAFFYAFGDTDNSDVIVSDDGSVFKTAILAANLVISSEGIIGQAGGNPTLSSANIIDVVVKNAVAADLA